MRIILPAIFIILLIVNFSYAQNPVQIEQETVKVEKVYPNPVNSFVYVEISLEDYAIARFQLIDILGNKIQEWEAQQLFPGDHKVKLQFKSLRTGIYLLKIRVGDKEFVKRIRKS